ncbi:MAG: cysteine synthase family protein, partial [Candidatus Micrarchaeota archaeon]|nr:cysteine synthase family protein [Candidatus Micrarchaeota archaeon]
KDRIALAMVEEAERKGELRKGMTIVEPTSGNTGISLAMVAAVKGYKAVLVMPENMSEERTKLMRAMGAELVLTPSNLGVWGSVEKAKEMKAKNGDFYMPDQFSNEANVRVHETTTAIEIWEQMGGLVDYFVAGIGSGGTITGVGRVLKARNPKVRVIAVEPSSPNHSIQGIGDGFVPAILDARLIDETIFVSDEQAYEMARMLAKKEGILAGISSGATLYGALEVAKKVERKNFVVIVADSATRYLSNGMF